MVIKFESGLSLAARRCGKEVQRLHRSKKSIAEVPKGNRTSIYFSLMLSHLRFPTRFWHEISLSSTMNDLLTNLLKLQGIDFSDARGPDAEVRRTELRALVPAQILGHYDRLVVRGKKGIAIVRNQVCTGCHMKLPIGTINTLMQGQDIQLCDTCGRYLCLASPAENAPAEAVAPAKPAAKPRKRKATAHAEI
jgi:hypothetical protein